MQLCTCIGTPPESLGEKPNVHGRPVLLGHVFRETLKKHRVKVTLAKDGGSGTSWDPTIIFSEKNPPVYMLRDLVIYIIYSKMHIIDSILLNLKSLYFSQCEYQLLKRLALQRSALTYLWTR